MSYKIYGHRGSRTRLPENTMPSFKLALEEGADGLEIDIRTTKDGEIVICHDKDLKRVGGVDFTVSGGISSMADIERLSELQLRKVIVGKAIYENRITLKDIERWLLNA